MLVNSVGRITTALFWMMTLYNDHDAILFYLLSNTYCCCLLLSDGRGMTPFRFGPSEGHVNT